MAIGGLIVSKRKNALATTPKSAGLQKCFLSVHLRVDLVPAYIGGGAAHVAATHFDCDDKRKPFFPGLGAELRFCCCPKKPALDSEHTWGLSTSDSDRAS